MSLGTWDPQAGPADTPITLEPALLQRLADYSRDGQLEQLAHTLPATEQQRLAGLMAVDHDTWRAAVTDLPDADIEHLVRFFAVAENLPGWEAGAASPAIPLARVLRERGVKLQRPFLLWLREVSDNRFLPYGPL